MKRARCAYLALVACLGSPMAANAGPILWTIEDVYFGNDFEFRSPTGDPILFVNELVAATGSFVYDADTSVVSDVNISSQDGEWVSGCTAAACTPDSVTIADFFGYSYSAGLYDSANGWYAFYDPSDRTQVLLLTFADALTNGGGIVAIDSAFEYSCGADCPTFDFGTTPFRNEVKGAGARVVGAAVPEPGTLALLGIGLAAMGLSRRRKTS